MRPLDPYRVVRWVGGRVAERRRTLGWTQEELAERLDVSIKYLQRLEAGQENLTIRSVVGLANALELPPGELMRSPAAPPAPRKPGRPRVRAKRRTR
ncbi:MAG TPA: helix-turn-helix transcriptional regulator [Kofleriaceae bacterium]